MPERLRNLRHRWRYTIVFGASLLLLVAPSLTAGWIEEDRSFDVLFSLLIVAVLLQVFEERDLRRIAISLGLAAFLGFWAGRATGGSIGRLLLVGAQLVAASFFAFALYGILRGIFVRRVSGDAIFGAVSGYLLLGIIWSLLFYALETATPGSFRLPAPSNGEVAAAKMDHSVLSYFSFITLATVGYGDVTPASPLARTLAWTEAVAGQFYLAILVAGIVGYQVTHGAKP